MVYISMKIFIRENFEKELACVCGYHVYRGTWEAAVGKVLECEREP